MKTLRELRAALKAKTEEARTLIDDAEKFAVADAEIRALSEQAERAERMEEIERTVEGRSLTGQEAEGADEWRSLARGEARSMSVAADGAAIVPSQLAEPDSGPRAGHFPDPGDRQRGERYD